MKIVKSLAVFGGMALLLPLVSATFYSCEKADISPINPNGTNNGGSSTASYADNTLGRSKNDKNKDLPKLKDLQEVFPNMQPCNEKEKASLEGKADYEEAYFYYDPTTNMRYEFYVVDKHTPFVYNDGKEVCDKTYTVGPIGPDGNPTSVTCAEPGKGCRLEGKTTIVVCL